MKQHYKIVAMALAILFTLYTVVSSLECTIATTSSTANTASYRWDSVNIGGGGFVTGVIPTCEDNIFYARTDVGGAYRLDTTTGKWTPLSNGLSQKYYGGLGVDSIAVDPSDANKVYIFCGYTYTSTEPSLLMRSTDGGATFTYIELPFQSYGNGTARNVGERLAVDPLCPTTLYCATRQQGIYKSTDSGSTWTQIREYDSSTGKVGTCMVMLDSSHPVNGTSSLYIADWKTSSQFYKYSGSGTTWQTLSTTVCDGAYPQRYAIFDGKAYITFANTDFESGPSEGFLGVLDFSNDTFQKINVSYTDSTNGTKNYPLSGISIDASGSGRMIVSTLNTYEDLYWNENTTQPYGEDWGTAVFTSTDGGSTWTNVNKAERIVLKTGGKDWVSDEKPHWSGDVTFLPNDTSKAILTSGNGTYMLSSLFDDDGKVYATFYTQGMEEIVPLDLVAPKDGNTVLASVAYDAGGFCHEDITTAPSKRLGTSVKDSVTIGTKGVAIDKTGIAVCENDSNLLVTCGETNTTSGTSVSPLQYSTDNGTTWKDVPGASSYGERGSCAISADGSIIYWLPTATADRYTENVGQTLYCFPYDKTADTFGSVSSQTVSGFTLYGARVMTDTVDNNLVYVSSQEGLYYSLNQGSSFNKITSSDTSRVNRMTVVPGVRGLVYEANGQWSDQSLSYYDIETGTNTLIDAVGNCEAVGFGKAASGCSFPAMYVWGTISGVTGLFRSTDAGTSWVRINDSSTQFGGVGNGKMLLGDRRVFGRVYMTTYGQGIVYGDSQETGSETSEASTTSNQSSQDNSSATTTSSQSSSQAPATTTSGQGSSQAPATTTSGQSSSQAPATTTSSQSSSQSSATSTSSQNDKNTPSSSEVSATSTTAVSSTVKKLAAPTKLKGSSKKKGKVTLSWKKVKNAKKYKIYYSKKKKGPYKALVSTSKIKVTFSKKMVSGKVFYFKVTAVDKNGNAGKYSTVKRIKVK